MKRNIKLGLNDLNNVTANATENTIAMKLSERYKYNVCTKVSFMDLIAQLHGESVEETKDVKNVGQIVNAGDSLSHVILIPDDVYFMSVARKALDFLVGDCKGVAGVEYKGLIVRKLLVKSNNKKFAKTINVVMVNDKIEELIIEEIKSCDLTSRVNIEKILKDIDDMFRRYSELTLDAAKKLYTFKTFFYTDKFRSESTIHIVDNFYSFKTILGKEATMYDEAVDPVPFAVRRNSNYSLPVDMPIGHMEEFIDDKTKEISKVLYKDTFAYIQDRSASFLADKVNGVLVENYVNTKLTKATIDSFELGGINGRNSADIYNVFVVKYNNAVSKKSIALENLAADITTPEEYAIGRLIIEEEFDSTINEINSQLAWIMKDLSLEEAGKLTFIASNIRVKTRQAYPREDSTNQFYTRVLPEAFFSYFAENFADIEYAEYKLHGDVEMYEEGDEVELINGNADGIYVDGSYSGIMTVAINDKGQKVLRKDIVDIIEENRVAPVMTTNMTVLIWESNFFDAYEFYNNKEIKKISWDEFNDGKFNIFNKKEFQEMRFYPQFEYINADGKKRVLRDVIIATLVLDSGAIIELPVAKYECIGPVMENALAGLVVKKSEINLKDSILHNHAFLLEVGYGTFDDTITARNYDVVTDDPFAVSNVTIDYTNRKANDISDAFGAFSDNVDFEDAGDDSWMA